MFVVNYEGYFAFVCFINFFVALLIICGKFVYHIYIS